MRSGSQSGIGFLLTLFAVSACASSVDTSRESIPGQASRAITTAPLSDDGLIRGMPPACLRQTANASELEFVCRLYLADMIHAEAGRRPVEVFDCNSHPDLCQAADTSVTIRIAVDYGAYYGDASYAQSIEVNYFNDAEATVETVTLRDQRAWVDGDNRRDHVPARPVEITQFKLASEVAASVFRLASILRREAEVSSWKMCRLKREDGSESIVLAQHLPVFVQIFFGGEELAYDRNTGGFGNAGRIFSAINENEVMEPDDGHCLPA